MDELVEERETSDGWAAAVLLAATFFVAIAPTLSWLQFGSSMENLVVATALEARRTGNWLLPALETEPRVAKPPLTTWIAAAAIRDKTFSDLDSVDPLVRLPAYRRLAWEIRWLALVSSCLMLLAIYDLGRTVSGVRGGILALVIAGSSFYFFRFARQVTTDVQLALWASVANAALARMCLRGVTWKNAIAAGLALGLAFMSKGPVTLLFNVLPVALFALWRRPWRRTRWLAPVITTLVLMLFVGLTWYAWVLVRVPEAWPRWVMELSRANPAKRADQPLAYGSILLFMMPWTPVFVLGLIWSGMETWKILRRREPWDGRERWVLMFLLTAVPVVVMSVFPDRKDRYLLPLLGPFALLAARALELTLQANYRGPKIPAWVQCVLIMVIGVALPMVGATRLARRHDGTPWYSPVFAAIVAFVIAAIIVVAILLSRRKPLALVAATVLVMLILHPIAYFGYRHTQSGLSDMFPLAELIRREYPEATMHHWRADNKRAPVDLSIYLNRSMTWTPQPQKLPPSTRPQMLIRLQNKDQPEPVPPPGWRFFAKVLRDEKDWYIAFVRESVRAGGGS